MAASSRGSPGFTLLELLVVVADGHVEIRKWLEASTVPDVNQLSMHWSFPVPGSRDFRWLHDRTRTYGTTRY